MYKITAIFYNQNSNLEEFIHKLFWDAYDKLKYGRTRLTSIDTCEM